ncbi:MlaA family lipoprotein [Nitrincola iocasae]|jgi:phospholipid-binding lipoprotein MlaA|uniref:VacJ family lipoprotein n=1 Tax=Nitrincola iocasae TaxID=2614693 RepID=A0A5J6LF08_9GAMM|nr:VacJ family lipoprotein [Nitrincola iocasae]QEW06916.1 VacJ family lipoprotein [Nitrincola iocasae]
MLSLSLRKLAITTGIALALSASAVQAQQENDPWEGFNRSMFSFNDGLDRAIIKPVTKGYRYVTPEIAQTGVNNFFENLRDFRTMLNNLLQGKVHNALEDFSRITFNSTFGLAGLIDVATPMGIPKNDEDFGQTLGHWGMSSGPYVVLPLFGPSTIRDTAGMVPDWHLDPVNYVDDGGARNSLRVLRLLDTRSQLLDAERIISGDRYIFIRDAYLQRREYLINDGVMDVRYDESDF